MLQTFLEPILKERIEKIQFLQNELSINDVDERKKTVDLLVKTKDKYIHIELNQTHKDYLHIRNFCFFTNLYSKNTRRGKEYDLTSEFIHIDLSYGKKDIKEQREYYVMDQDGWLYIENIKMIEYNMDMITAFWYTANEEKIEEYKYLIMLGLDRESLDQISKGDQFMEEYTKKVEKLNDSDVFTSWITPEEDAEIILNTEKHISYNEGMLAGVAKGIQTTAQALLQNGVDIHVVAISTGLSLQELQQLQQ